MVVKSMFVTKGGRLSGGVSVTILRTPYILPQTNVSWTRANNSRLRTPYSPYIFGQLHNSIVTGCCQFGTTTIYCPLSSLLISSVILFPFRFASYTINYGVRSSILHYQSRRISRDSLQHFVHGPPLLYNCSSFFSSVFLLVRVFLAMEPTSQSTAPQQARQQPVYDIRNGGHYGKLA